MLTYGCLLGALLVSSPLAARHTLRSGAAVGDSRVFRLRDSVVVEMRIDLAGMEVRSDRSVVLIPSLCDGERTIALPAVEVMGRRRALYYERNGSPDLRPTALSGRAEGPGRRRRRWITAWRCPVRNGWIVFGWE